MSAWEQMDKWCQKRAERVAGPASKHIMAGGSLHDPDYRALLGESRAYLAMRSFIKGAIRNQSASTRKDDV